MGRMFHRRRLILPDGRGSAGSEAGAARRRAPSLRGRLLVLVALLVASLLALAGISVWQAHEAARERAADGMLSTARAMAMLVDREFARAEALLVGLSADPDIAAGSATTFLAAVQRLGDAADGAVLLLARPDGVGASSAEGALARRRPMPGGLDLVFREGRTAISDLHPGRITGGPVIGIAIPVGGRPDAPADFALAMARQLRGSLRVETGAGGQVVAEFPTRLPSSPIPADPAASR